MQIRLRPTMLGLGIALLAGLSLGAEIPPRETTQATAVVASGELLKRRVFVILDAERGVVRKTYAVWAGEGQRDLHFEWITERPSLDDAELVSGDGKLVWRKRGSSHYDARSVVSIYRGAMKSGRAEGEGELRTDDGTLYRGQWHAGHYHGHGALQLGDGSNYEGAFKDGRFEGEGRFVQADGETFEGSFVGGLKNGIGKTRLPSGGSYTSTWTHGTEDADSRRVRLAQGMPFRAAQVQFVTGDLQISFQTDIMPKSEESGSPGEPISYIARNEADAVVIEPDDQLLLKAWNNTGLLSDPFLGMKVASPVALNVRVKNVGAKALQIRKSYVEIDKSVLDPRPLYELWQLERRCVEEDLETRVIFRNHGWGEVKSAKAQFAFESKDGSRRTPTFVATMKLKKSGSAVYDLKPNLLGLGVNLKRLAVNCDGLKPAACHKRTVALGGLGKLTDTLSVLEGGPGTMLSGQLEYTWVDEGKVLRKSIGKFRLVIPLYVSGFCAEAASSPEWDARARLMVPLALDKASYRLPLAFSRVVPQSQSVPLGLILDAEKSSQHRFRLVLELGDGRIIRSRDIRLLFIAPLGDALSTYTNPYEDEYDENGEPIE